MDFFEDLLKRHRPQKLRTRFREEGPVLFTKKYKRVLIGVLLVVVVSIIVSIALVVLLIRWLWSAGTTTVNTNPTVSSVVESAKESAQSLLPTVPANAEDFIQNGVVNEAKINETFSSLPSATKEVWKNALQANITKQLETATGATQQQLEVLAATVSAL